MKTCTLLVSYLSGAAETHHTRIPEGSLDLLDALSQRAPLPSGFVQLASEAKTGQDSTFQEISASQETLMIINMCFQVL